MPGAGKQSPAVQDQIKQLLEAGFDPTTIHRKLKVGRSSIYRMKRCLQQHGTNYMPPELNKKNGRPKVLTADQELEVRDWLRDPKNRNRYLDDLVWLIHDRFGIVCSTTTMSKMKRKWMRVIDCEELGQPLDDQTRAQLMETHPDLPILHEAPVASDFLPVSQADQGVQQQEQHHLMPTAQMQQLVADAEQHQQHQFQYQDLDPDKQPSQYLDSSHQQSHLMDPSMTDLDQLQQQIAASHDPYHHLHHDHQQIPQMDPQLESQLQTHLEPQMGATLEQQLHHNLTAAAAAAVAVGEVEAQSRANE